MKKLGQITNAKPGEADYTFYCPGCECNHGVHVNSGDVRWTFTGSMERPTVRPSLLHRYVNTDGADVVCHYHITNGTLEYLNDCTHHLSGQTVEMEALPDFPETGSMCPECGHDHSTNEPCIFD